MIEQVKLIHAVIVALPAFSLEPVPETPEDRSARLEIQAEAHWQAAESRPVGYSQLQWAAVLSSLVWHESKQSLYVQSDLCETGPVGMRCDSGKARSPYQLHQSACPALWKLPKGDPAGIFVGAKCASRLLASAQRRCASRAPTNLMGAYSGYAGASCVWEPARRRERTSLMLFGAMANLAATGVQ